MLDLETLRIIWWGLMGFLFISFAVTDGFDFGTAILLPFVTRNEVERSIVLNTIRPFWEGNQVWIILGAGAVFAAWPFVYAVAFSGAYFAILLLLLTMGISRPVSFKYRSKIPNYYWRRSWDWLVFIGGFAPAIIFGILVGNALQGLPFYFDNELRITYSGSFLQLFNPFALWCGLTSLCMLVMHGATYLALKTEDVIHARAIMAAKLSSLFLLFFFCVGGFLVAKFIVGFQTVGVIDHGGYSNPLHKQIATSVGAWMQNYSLHPRTILAPAIGMIAPIFVFITISIAAVRWAFIFSSISITAIITTVGLSMYPFILPSSVHPTSSLLIWDASSSKLTLLMMLVAVIIFIPLIMVYTAWVYRVLSGKVRASDIETEEKQHVY